MPCQITKRMFPEQKKSSSFFYKEIMSSIKSHSSNNRKAIIEPAESDIVFGRGRGCMNRNGNKSFRMIVDLHRGEYLSTSNKNKTNITRKVMKIIETMGGRFLEQCSSTKTFEEASDKRIFDKVSHALRETKLMKSSTNQDELLIRQQQIFCDLLSSDVVKMEQDEEDLEAIEDDTSFPAEESPKSLVEQAEDITLTEEPDLTACLNPKKQYILRERGGDMMEPLYEGRIYREDLIMDVGFPTFQTSLS